MVLAVRFTKTAKWIRKYGKAVRSYGENKAAFGRIGFFSFGRRKSHFELDFKCFKTISQSKCGIGTEIALVCMGRWSV